MTSAVCVLLGEKVKGTLHFEQQVQVLFSDGNRIELIAG